MIRLFNQYVSSKCLLLAAMEGILIALAFLCGAKLRYWNRPEDFDVYMQFPGIVVQLLAVVVIFQICFYCSDLYDLQPARPRSAQIVYLGQSLGAASLILGVLYILVPNLLPGRGVFIIGATLVGTFVLLSRIALDRLWKAAAPEQNVLILGNNNLAMMVVRELRKREDLNLRIVGYFDPTPGGSGAPDSIGGQTVFREEDGLEDVVARENVTRVLVAMEERRGFLPIRELVRFRVQGIRVEEAHAAMSALSGRVGLQTVRPSWFVFTDGFHRSRLTLLVKRVIDLGCALLGLFLSLPAMAAVAIAIRLDSKGPIVFRQTRVGLRGESFELLKFRSMRVDAEEGTGAQWAQENDPRVTRVGRFIRDFRLDELPQFINVIRGHMSFVGPRPERPCFVNELSKKIPYYEERHSVRPGITGWAQVQYRYGSTVEDASNKLEYDLFYLKNMSLAFDLAIIFKTVRIVVGARGSR